MKSEANVRLCFLCTFTTLLLAGCGGSPSSSNQVQSTEYQLSVTAPAAGEGTITSSPAGISCPSTCSASFAKGTQVILTETPGSNYVFSGWSGSCTGTSACSITLNASASVTPSFTAEYALTVTAVGTGTVTSAPAGINCPSACTASFAKGTQVTLTETPGSGGYFGGWSGGCTGTTCSLTVTGAENVTANFTTGDVVAVTLAGGGSGTVSSSPAGISCPGTCSASFAPGTQVTLTETPSSNNSFTGWSGSCTGTSACALTLSAASSVTATFTPGNPYSALNHIILFAQENRSFDHYFGYMRQYWANNGIPDQSFDGLPQFNPNSGITPLYGPPTSVPGCQLSTDADSCTPDPTNPIQSFSFHTLQLNSGQVGTVCEENQSPFWNEAHNDWDYANPADQPAEVNSSGAPNPPLNGFVFTAAYDAQTNGFMDVNGVRAMGYFQDADLNFYYFMATQFGTSDRWFAPVMDRTQINRAYIYAATSQGYAYPPGQGNQDNAPFNAKTIFEALQDAGINWKIYVNPTNTYYKNASGVTEDCSAEAAGQAQDMCLAGASYMNQFIYEAQVQNPATNLWQHFGPISDLQTDMQNDATFPQFAYIEPASNAGLDEHPSDADGSPVDVQLGAQYVENSIIQPFLQSAVWQDSAMIFTYDEPGGLYDHVSPQPAVPPGDDLSPFDLESGDICDKTGESLGLGTCSFAWTGYRVPMIVISPYSRQNFVSHTVRDTTAVLKMVETRFGLSQLTNRDGSQADMTEFFDFVNKPWSTPPTLPAQTVVSVANHCDQTPPSSWNEPPEVTAHVAGSGSISSSPASAIANCASDCTGVFSTGTTVTLTATPNAGSTFTGWSGACSGAAACTLTPTGQLSVTATFTP